MQARHAPLDPADMRPHAGAAHDLADFDWRLTPLGPMDAWPSELRTAVSICIHAEYAAAVYWGDAWTMVHNVAFAPIVASRGGAQGRPAAEVWGEWWPAMRADFERISISGTGMSAYDKHFEILDDGPPREEFWNYSYTPIAAADGRVAGIFVGARESTADVQQRRTDSLLVALDEQLLAASTVDEAVQVTLSLLGTRLSAPRTGFGEIDTGANLLHIRPCWTDGTMPDIAGRYPLGTFGRISDDLRAGHAVVIEDNLTDPRTNDPDEIAQYEIAGLRAGIVVPILADGRYAGGIFVQSNVPKRWLPHHVALAEAATRRMWQAIVRKRTDIALRDREQRYRLIFEQAEDIIFTADADQRITDCNRAGATAVGMPREAIIGRSIADFVSTAGFEQTSAMLQHKIDHGGNTRHEVTVNRPDGRTMLWENNSTLIRDLDDKPIGLLSISRDVTERRAFDERRELLIHELNHRVKNTLSLVQGLAHQSFRAGQDPQTASSDFLSRLSALAVAHDLLTREQWEGVTLSELVRGATAHAGERVDATGSHLLVSPKSAVALVMALHELTTNAVKYGALSTPSGRATVDWAAQPGGRFLLTWRESGGPTVEAPSRRGFGVRMIERALASDLGGIVHIDFAPSGIVCTIDGPVLT
jgi:PAS domain S-box-containing protein